MSKAIDRELESMVLSAVLTDPTFYNRYISAMEVSSFSDTVNRQAVSILLLYTARYSRAPSREEFLSTLTCEYNANRITEDMYKECSIRINEYYTLQYDTAFVRDNLVKITTRNKVVSAILESAALLNKAGTDIPQATYDEIYKKITEALSLRVVEHQGLLFNDIARTLGEYLKDQTRFDPTCVVTTGVSSLDNCLMAHGMLPGELFVVSAPPGRGKSSFLVNAGSRALKAGKNVCHILVGDNTVSDGASRYASCLTGVDAMSIRADSQDYYRRWEMLQSAVGKLVLESYCIGGPTINDIRQFINRAQINYDVKFDLIIIDYLDNCKLPQGNNSYERLGHLYESCKQVAEELSVPIFTASQPKIGSWRSSEGGLDVLAGSSLKQAVVDGQITLSQVEDGQDTSVMYLHPDKLRRGISRQRIKIRIDYQTQTVIEVKE